MIGNILCIADSNEGRMLFIKAWNDIYEFHASPFILLPTKVNIWLLPK